MDDLVRRLREPIANQTMMEMIEGEAYDPLRLEAAFMIERLLANAKEDAVMLSAYHKWCEMNGVAPSSSDLIAARAALGEKKE